MRILHVNKFLYRRGGAEGYMLDVAELQRGVGDTVEFFGMQHPDNPAYTFEDSFPAHVEFDPPPASLPGKARAIGRMIHGSSAARGLAEVVATFRPDVAHLHNVYHQLSPAILRPLAEAGIPTVMTLHDYKLVCPTYQMLAGGSVCEACIGGSFLPAITRRCNGGSLAASAVSALESTVHRRSGAWGRVDLFVCPSKFLESKMRDAGVFPDRLRHANHFVTPVAEQVARHAGADVVFAGRLSPEKGVDVLIDAFGEPPLRSIEAEVVILGDGPEREALERRASAVAPGRISFRGRVSKDEVLREVSNAVVAAVPSRWHENQPMSVLEAFACGTPVVATTLGGLPELINPGVDGALVEPNDAPGLAEALASFVVDPDAAARMGRVGRARLAEDFSVERHLSALEHVYHEAAGLVAPTPIEVAR